MEISKELQQRMRTYKGDSKHLQTALGAYLIGQMYGWRVISLMNSPSIVARCNRILGFDLQERCPATTSLSKRVNGIRLAEKIDDFWEIARSYHPDKRLAGDHDKNEELAL